VLLVPYGAGSFRFPGEEVFVVRLGRRLLDSARGHCRLQESPRSTNREKCGNIKAGLGPLRGPFIRVLDWHIHCFLQDRRKRLELDREEGTMNRWTNIFGAPSPSSPVGEGRAPETPAPVSTPVPHEALGGQFGEAAEAAASALGKRLQSMAKDMNARSGGIVGSLATRHLPGGGALGVATQVVALGLDRSGKFLESEGFHGAVKGVSEQMKRNPIPFLLVGIGLGYLAGRHTKSRES
jgi:hypothetical protein